MKHLTANYHTHTFRCHHARGADRDYVENAIRAGVRTLGFSDHSPMIFKTDYYSGFRVPLEMTADYFESLSRLREEYKNEIRILIGVEAEYYPALFEGYLDYMAAFPLDYMILGQHFVWDEQTGFPSFQRTEDPDRLRQYYENVLAGAATGKFLYIAHPEVLKYDGDKAAYQALTADFLTRVKPLGIPLELNRLGFAEGRHYPRREFWELCGAMEIPAVIGLDAHDPAVFQDEAAVDGLREFARSCGVTVLTELEI